jgi:hypothetical protein
MNQRSTLERRAQRLLRWYPASWRERYGEEFTELLVAELDERPDWSGRTMNIVGNGVLARLSGAGLTGNILDGPDQTRASLATLICSMAVFLALGISMWAQLTIGWQWSAPDTSGTTVAVVGMSLGVVAFAALALLATLPVILTMGSAFARRSAHGLGRPLLLATVGFAVLVVGSRHFGNGWPGTGGHPWAHQGLVPGGVAAFSWASTLSITSYWLHPDALLSFPAAEVAWMFLSPIAMVLVAVGSVKIVRRLQIPEHILRFEVLLGELTAAIMVLFAIAAGVWMLRGGAGPRGLFATGSIDRFALIAMTVALLVALGSLRRARPVAFLRPTD